MKKIALEGPINACSDKECVDWRKEVIDRLGQYYTFHNPMDFDCRGKEKELVAIDTLGITSSDYILVMAEKPGWGTAMGVQMAWAMHKHIIAICSSPTPSPWLKNRCNSIFPTLEDAISWLLCNY